ncbi:MAG: caspase family protein [Rubrivivax sp.]|nr:caspase family protein [Rubrivivax sp.]
MRRGPAVWLAVAAMLATTLPAQAQAPAPAARGTRHALVIGIGEYADPELPTLRGMPLDVASARRMAQAMAIPEANVTLLRDRAATAAGIREALAQLNARVQDGDRVFVYYSGHGTRWYDPVLKAEGCTEGLMAADGQVISNIELGTRLAPLARRADKLLVFYDACFSGGLAESPLRTRSLPKGAGATITPKFVRGSAPDTCGEPANFRTRSLPGLLQQRSAMPENVVQVAASRPDEVSFDSSATGGFATAAWRDCLLGEARDLDGSGAITVDEVTQCAQAQLDRALAGVPGVRGQQMTMVGNTRFVPAWGGGAAKESARRVTPAEILAEVHGQRDGQRRVVATTRQGTLKIGRDALEIDVTPSRDGHLYVAMAGSDGQSLVLLYPNDLAGDNRVRAGQRVALPGPGWEVVAGGPPGIETLLVMVTDAPRDLSSLGRDKTGPFMKTLLDAEGRARLQAVLAGGTPGTDCGQPGRPPCTDAFGAALLKVESVR